MESQQTDQRKIKQLIVFGVLFAALVYLAIRFIAAIVEVLVLFSLVALIVIVLTPPVGWLERRRVPRPLSAAIIALLAVGLVGLVAWLAIPLAVREVRDLLRHLPEYAARISKFLSESGMGGGSHTVVKTEQIGQMLYSRAGAILSRIGTYTLDAAELIASALVVFISTVYILSSPRPVAEGILRVLQPGQAEKFTDEMQKISHQMQQWALSVLAGMAVVFVLAWMLLGPILHVQFAFVFALTAGLLEIVPTLGPILSAIPPILVGFSDSPMKGLWVLVGFTVIQQIESHLIIPLILGRGVKLHPASVVFAVVVMAWLFGIVGIFLAVPLCAVTKTLIEDLYIAPKEAKKQRDLSDKVEQIVSGPTEEEKPEE